VLLSALVRRTLDQIAASRVNPVIALVASLTATLSPTLQREGNIAGGACVAVALALGALLVHTPEHRGERRPWLWVGALVGLCALESPAAAVVLALALLAQGVLLRPGGGERAGGFFVAGFLGAAVVGVLPWALRAGAPRALLELGLGSGASELRALDVASLQARGIGSWIADVGIAAFALTWLGALIALLRKGARWAVAPMLLLLALDVALPASNSGVLSADPLGALRSLSVCAAALLAAVGVQFVSLSLLTSKLALARPGSALVVAFHLTLAAISAEEGVTRAYRVANAGCETWTDEALERLPPQSLLLVRSDAVALRLWSAKVVSGKRPDVTLVPLPLLGRGRLAASLLAQEPAILPLLRDVSATGSPSEYALSQIGDVRPLLVELDPRWDRRLATHAVPERLWLRFSPQPLGLSDRRLAQNVDSASFYRVVGASRRDEIHDEATLEVLASHAAEQAASAALVGDRELTQRSLAQLSSLKREPDEALLTLIDPSRKVEARATTKGHSRRR
jgi:hypothetical protein